MEIRRDLEEIFSGFFVSGNQARIESGSFAEIDRDFSQILSEKN